MLESSSSPTLTFLSTPSVRRATNEVVRGDVLIEFYPRPPRGGRLAGCGADVQWFQFLSTPSVRRATI